MRMMLEVVWPFTGSFLVIYFDGILIYSRNKEKHLTQLWQVMGVLSRGRLYINLKMCSLCDHILFIDYIVFARGLKVDPEKIEAIAEWPTLKLITDIRNFHGLVCF